MIFARIGIFEGDGHALESVVRLFEDRISSEFATLNGFLGYQAFVEEGAERYVGISYWTSLDTLEASEKVAGVARAEAEKLGARIAGSPMIVRQAFDTRLGTILN